MDSERWLSFCSQDDRGVVSLADWEFVMSLFKVVLLYCGFFAFPAFGQQVMEKETEALQRNKQVLPLKVIDATGFCRRLNHHLRLVALKTGLNPANSELFAKASTLSLISDLKLGYRGEFLRTDKLAANAQLPKMHSQPQYVSVANLLSFAMGSSKELAIVTSPSGLKRIPHAQQGIEVLLVAHKNMVLNANRAQQVANAAKRLNIRVHVLWVGNENAHTRNPVTLPLIWTAAATGGSVANLGGAEAQCLERDRFI
jgi:hypothetical protein